MRNLTVEQQYSPILDATTETHGFTTDINAPYTFSSSLPTQVFKVYAKNNATTNYSRIIGEKSYELNDHLGNIRVVISDRKYLADRDDSNTISTGDNFVTEVLSANEYGAFGNLLNGRGFSKRDYSRGFNGMLKDNEVKGNGNSYTTEFRQYDPRIGRWLSLDPLSQEFPWQSPYNSMSNNPILRIDPKGDADGVYLDEETGEVLGTDEKGVEDGLVHYTSKENWEKYGENPMIEKKSIALNPGVSKTINLFDELTNMKNNFLTITGEYQVPDLNEDLGTGVTLFEQLIIAGTEYTINTAYKYPEPKAMTAAANQTLRSLSKAVGNLATAWLITDQGIKIFNALSKQDFTKATQATTVLTGYLVAADLMKAPHPYVKLVGCAVLLGTGVYQWATTEEDDNKK
jgi:RHS repeat-associated protein